MSTTTKIGADDLAIAGAGNQTLNKVQVRDLILAAQTAYHVQAKLGMADESFDVWRKAALHDAAGKASFRAVTQREYGKVLAYFVTLAGKKPATRRAAVKSQGADDADRARWSLDNECRQQAEVFGSYEGRGRMPMCCWVRSTKPRLRVPRPNSSGRLCLPCAIELGQKCAQMRCSAFGAVARVFYRATRSGHFPAFSRMRNRRLEIGRECLATKNTKEHKKRILKMKIETKFNKGDRVFFIAEDKTKWATCPLCKSDDIDNTHYRVVESTVSYIWADAILNDNGTATYKCTYADGLQYSKNLYRWHALCRSPIG